ncbi:hypothetical protein BJ875DRAFT_540047 [Amylocarpus encephaloides]|uniref:Extracellular serine-rich protein n=1 Tax=Amylocarpus encephaloides TaxID=45428 RepID=A0A9P7YQG6_9HELO|nr:hypothetical protein BJ875DRAFT_540047 [Amylocarpus encephaloides]
MLSTIFSRWLWAILAFLCLGTIVDGHKKRGDKPEHLHHGNQTLHRPAPQIPTTIVKLNGTSIAVNTTGASPGNGKVNKREAVVGSAAGTKSTFLVFARDAASAYSAYSGLNDYGIPYELVIVPAAGITLPPLQSSDTNPVGNYGGFVVLAEVSYEDSAGNWGSAITAAQWTTIYNYQTKFGVRMIRLDVFPSEATGTRSVGSCCADTVDQPLYISDTSQFPTAGLKQGVKLSSLGLYHYPAAITDSTTTTQFALFSPVSGFSDVTVAGVINNFSGRKQMVFFMPMAMDWSLTSSVLTHAWIHWATRGLYAGYRRLLLNTQVDDMFLLTTIWDDSTTFRITPADLATHVQWQGSVLSKMPVGSNYTIEIGHNGNGNIEASYKISKSACKAGPVYRVDSPQTPLEFVKPLGTGTSLWPNNQTIYTFTDECLATDSLAKFFQVPATRDSFMHVSHTFTHEDEDNATESDVLKEITWNQRWLQQMALSNAKWFSPSGIIPPAITGLHNGDALKTWKDNGIVNVVGDNTRSALLNSNNEHWPLISNVAANGYDGIQITPRWATNIYYNCDDVTCDLAQWNSIGTKGDFAALLKVEEVTNTRHLLRLHHDPFMFHQANMRWVGVDKRTINGVTGQYSLLQMWVETVVAEVTRIVNWPIISLKHDDIAAYFQKRMTRDACNYILTQQFSGSTITGFTLSAPSVKNRCSVPIPVTVPGALADNGIVYNTEKIGNDPLTVWIDLNGRAVDLKLKTPIPW